MRTGEGAIVAARLVVTGDVDAYAVARGNPARELKRRFAKEVVAELLRIRRWDREIEKFSADIGAIIRADVNAPKGASDTV